ncbi:protein unc-13 homolog A-like [Galendromus occidentalis]|uniref:Protein unc-13 homolog A-like n=1 Tax=Galendromus occidentalis TaxID=34638 RepID=A0AAJ7SD37_9ACAR|nr:protein unc-13 homolog A-like [Galendromus occidentalis]
MSLLCVTVRSAFLKGVGAQTSSYVVLKLQNVKSTTVAVRGNNPTWEQDFIFETSQMDASLVVELWNKGMLWDKLVGCALIPLQGIQYSAEPSEGVWLTLDAEFINSTDGHPQGTKTPTGHQLLIEAHFELPYEISADAGPELADKLQMLNTIMDEEVQHNKRGMFALNSGVSEDSDYTSDVGYPAVGSTPSGSHPPPLNTQHVNVNPSVFGGAGVVHAHLQQQYNRQTDQLVPGQDTNLLQSQPTPASAAGAYSAAARLQQQQQLARQQQQLQQLQQQQELQRQQDFQTQQELRCQQEILKQQQLEFQRQQEFVRQHDYQRQQDLAIQQEEIRKQQQVLKDLQETQRKEILRQQELQRQQEILQQNQRLLQQVGPHHAAAYPSMLRRYLQ